MDLLAISIYFDRRCAYSFLSNAGLVSMCRPVPVPLDRL